MHGGVEAAALRALLRREVEEQVRFTDNDSVLNAAPVLGVGAPLVGGVAYSLSRRTKT
jgi:hypothetical protein